MENIPTTMQCVVCHAPGDYRVETRAVPEVGEGEVLVRVLAVGVCAGDAKCFAGVPYFWGDKEKGHPQYVEPPVIPGHEFVGEVVRLGPGAGKQYGLEVGDHAVSENIVPCWKCRYCKRGNYNMCIPHAIYGFKQISQGAMATYMKYPKGAINHKVPRSIPAWQAAFIEPLACSVHAVELGSLQSSDVVVVAGCGPLGLGMVAAARLKGPRLLVALDLLDWKLEVAKRCGADKLLNPAQCDVVEEVRKLTDGFGCDVYIEATGHPASVRQGLSMLIKEGRFVEYGIFAVPSNIDWSVIAVKEIKVFGGHLAPGCYPKAISMLENNQLPMEDIVTHQLGLEETVRGIKMVHTGKDSLKVVILPNKK